MKSFSAVKVMLVLAVALAATVAHANLITNPGFETYETIHIFGFPGLPTVYGDWGGDPGTIVGAENGISPAGGAQMLRFDATGNYPDPYLTHCQIYQLIDISSYAAEIAACTKCMNSPLRPSLASRSRGQQGRRLLFKSLNPTLPRSLPNIQYSIPLLTSRTAHGRQS